ncbi:MAG TPA: hypothetical protein VFT14_04265 [Solirubrobacterales bacterium]|nr:hypothetical protein [Solirubrobacterales bacterium]
MSGEEPEVLICGFGDLGSGLGGLAWDLADGGAILLSDGKARPGSFALEEGGDAATLEISAGDANLEVVLVPEADAVALPAREGAAAAPIFTALRAEVRSSGLGRTLPCPGHLTRWTSDPIEGAGTFRHLAIELDLGARLIATAWGEPGLEGHGDERTSAWRIDADGSASGFEEALLSTQYDGDGHPTRAGLELWPGDDAPPMRTAASLIGGAEAGGAWAGLFRCHTDGTEGLGSYLLWRG